MKVLIVSGFLGAGKTTFIKELIRRSGKLMVVLENEFGQTDLDSQELKQSGPSDLKLLEFMEGCVCCTKKDAFSNTILAISAGLDPEYLIVEPTGVGKLSNILTAIRKVSYAKIELLKPLVVISPRNYQENLAEFKEIYQDQIRYAGRIVFSKTEQLDASVVADTAKRIRQLNPEAELVWEHYSGQDRDWWLSLLQDETALQIEEEEQPEFQDVSELTLKHAELKHPGELVILLEDVIHNHFGLIPRAKGVLKVGGEWLRFDVADRMYAISGVAEADPTTQCVFIGRDIQEHLLAARLSQSSFREGRRKGKPLVVR